MASPDLDLDLDPGEVLRRRRDVRYRHLEPECIVVRQEASEVLVLNQLGGRVLELVDGQHTVGALIRTVSAEHREVALADVERDVRRFLAELLAAGVVERAAA